jgi:hypothetical protein
MTAVEWLEEQLIKTSIPMKIMLNANNELVEQAKEMEKQQMFKALIKGVDVHGAYDIELEFKEYYNETFKSE